MGVLAQVFDRLLQWMHGPVTDYYTEDKLIRTEEEMSPSGRTRLVIRYYKTKDGCWNYSRGTLYRDDVEIADIKRNYSRFHHSWVEDETNGQEYLISGRSYMNQCIVNCDTGQEREEGDEARMKSGWGFCWAKAWLFGNTLIVDGCYWACPYEFKFFDFSNPMEKGWPELDLEGADYVSAYEVDPIFNEDGTMTFLETENGKPDGELEIRLTLRREGDVMKVVEEWKSEKRIEEDAEWDEE